MREMTKTSLRLPWALSLLGVRQVVGLADPQQGAADAQATFDAFSRLAEREMGDVLGEWFQAGDRLQTGLVDTLFDLVATGTGNPTSALGTARDTLQRSWSALRRGLSTGGGA